MHTNVRTMFSMCREVLAPMTTQRSGVIVNMASVLTVEQAETAVGRERALLLRPAFRALLRNGAR
jgi:NAD(P)-dependent dehydrogenase (short-subunit alcohol dehydrogenase family)